MRINIQIIDATEQMAGDLLAIYSPYVEKTAITFDLTPPDRGTFAAHIRSVQAKKFPWLVLKVEDEIVGYAYADTFKNRRAYDRSVEVSIYIAEGYHQSGLGRMLYEALETHLKSLTSVTNLYACIAYPNQEDEYLTYSSVRFHEKMGYKVVGRFTDCAAKFGRLYSMVWMEKIIS